MQLIKIKDIHENNGQIEGVPANPRQWKRGEVAQLAKSIQETPELFDLRPIIVYDNVNEFVVLGGNMRLAAAKHLGRKDVPCEIVSRETPKDKLKEIVIKDNASFGAWDFDALANEWDDLPIADWGVKGMPEMFEETEQPKEITDVPAEQPKETRCKKGDVWILGKHRLICGDSTDVNVIDRLMDGTKADMVFTDPPYGNGTSGKYGRGQLGVRTIAGDEDLSAFNDFVSIMNEDKIIYFLQWRTLAESLETVINKGLKINTVAVWDKKNAGLNGAGGISEQWEALVFAGNIKYKKFGGNVFSIAREQHKREDSPHPRQKPIKLLAEIFDFLDGCESVLDPFGGSGSTLIACEQLNRICYMCELDPNYCDVIIARWEKLTSKKAVKYETN